TGADQAAIRSRPQRRQEGHRSLRRRARLGSGRHRPLPHSRGRRQSRILHRSALRLKSCPARCAFLSPRRLVWCRAMTLPGTIAAAASAAPRAVWRAEIVETVKLAWPMALTQLGQIAMMTTDLALIGRLGQTAIAAVGLAHLILFVGFVLGMGPVSAVTPLAAQAFGAREPRMVRRSLRVGLWAALMLGIPVNVAQLWGEDI